MKLAETSGISLVGLFCLCAVAGCDSDKDLGMEIRSREPERIELRHKYELLEFRLSAQDQSALHARLDELQRVTEENRAEISTLRAEHRTLLDEVTAIEHNMQQKIDEFRKVAHSRGKDRSFDVLETRNGTIYQKAKVINVSDLGVQIQHQEGMARLGYEDLTDSQREIFAIDAEANLAARETENRKIRENDALLAAAEKKKADLAQSSDPKPATIRSEFLRSSIPTRVATTSSSTSTLSKPPTTFGSGYIYRYRPSRYSYSDRPTVYRNFTPSPQSDVGYAPVCPSSDRRSFTNRFIAGD